MKTRSLNSPHQLTKVICFRKAGDYFKPQILLKIVKQSRTICHKTRHYVPYTVSCHLHSTTFKNERAVRLKLQISVLCNYAK